MNLITDTWRGLVRRKLWPVALLLVAAIVAVPFALAKEPEVTPAPANAAVADDGLPVTYVTSAGEETVTDEETGKRRRTLGEAKDPFEPAPLPKKKTKKKKASSSAKQSDDASTKTDSSQSSSDDDAAGGGSAGGSSDPAPSTTPEPTATPTPAPANSVKVRFSRTENLDNAKAKTVERLEVLPSVANPLIVYKGVEDDGKVAVFELTGTVTVEGDASCKPSADDCQHLELRAGETVFITVTDTGEATDAQYVLEVLKVNAKSKASSAKLSKHKAEDALRSFDVVE